MNIKILLGKTNGRLIKRNAINIAVAEQTT